MAHKRKDGRRETFAEIVHDVEAATGALWSRLDSTRRTSPSPATDLRYAPNKLHGDEIESAGGTTFREQHPHEWLSRGEIEELLQRVPTIELLLVDDNAGYPPSVYRAPGDPMKSWRRRLSPLYISDDGLWTRASVGASWPTGGRQQMAPRPWCSASTARAEPCDLGRWAC